MGVDEVGLTGTAVADAKGRRVDASTGIAFAVLALVSFFLPGTPPKADDSIAKITQFFADNRSDQVASTFLLGIATLFFFWFIGSLRSYLRAAEGGEGRLSVASLGAGVAAMTLVLIGAGLANAIAFKLAGTPGDGSAVRALFDASNSVFALAAFPFAVFIGAASCSAARSGALPPWAYWAGSVVAVVQLLGGLAVFAKSGAFAAGGAATIVPPMTAIAWVVAISIVMIGRGGVPPLARTEP